MIPNELKEITDGNKIYFGYFPKDQYTPNISSGRFTELKYNNQPLFLGKSDVTQKVLSIRFNDTNDDFTNSCVVKLMNPTIDEATGSTTTRECGKSIT